MFNKQNTFVFCFPGSKKSFTGSPVIVFTILTHTHGGAIHHHCKNKWNCVKIKKSAHYLMQPMPWIMLIVTIAEEPKSIPITVWDY
jgi:hypothetical protein